MLYDYRMNTGPFHQYAGFHRIQTCQDLNTEAHAQANYRYDPSQRLARRLRAL